MDEYRVNLELYNGPLDLLLYLIRREEVDICDIPIAGITEQYLSYVEVLKELNPNLAGEFIVLAATLMEIKTRMLLPTVVPEEEDPEGVEIDPRAELVRQLLEYKAFKDAAGDLGTAAGLQAMKFPRPGELPKDDRGDVDLEEVQLWTLFDAFSKLMIAIGADAAPHEVIHDDTPMELHATDILDRLRRDGPLTFAQVFAGRTVRSEIVGLFLAMLELVRRRQIHASQERAFEDVHLHLNPNPPDDSDDDRDDAPPSDNRAGGEGEYIPQPGGGFISDDGGTGVGDDDNDHGQGDGVRI